MSHVVLGYVPELAEDRLFDIGNGIIIPIIDKEIYHQQFGPNENTIVHDVIELPDFYNYKEEVKKIKEQVNKNSDFDNKKVHF